MIVIRPFPVEGENLILPCPVEGWGGGLLCPVGGPNFPLYYGGREELILFSPVELGIWICPALWSGGAQFFAALWCEGPDLGLPCGGEGGPDLSQPWPGDKCQVYVSKLFVGPFFLSQPKLNYNSTQPNITKVGFDTKMSLHAPTYYVSNNSTSAISRLFLTRFNQTLKVGFWDQQQHEQQKQH